MITETRPTHRPPSVILVLTPGEAKLIETILGSLVQDDNGLIAKLRGEYRLSDGYGLSYLSLWIEPNTERTANVIPDD